MVTQCALVNRLSSAATKPKKVRNLLGICDGRIELGLADADKPLTGEIGTASGFPPMTP
jgi:hypothetical protein